MSAWPPTRGPRPTSRTGFATACGALPPPTPSVPGARPRREAPIAGNRRVGRTRRRWCTRNTWVVRAPTIDASNQVSRRAGGGCAESNTLFGRTRMSDTGAIFSGAPRTEPARRPALSRREVLAALHAEAGLVPGRRPAVLDGALDSTRARAGGRRGRRRQCAGRRRGAVRSSPEGTRRADAGLRRRPVGRGADRRAVRIGRRLRAARSR